LVLVHGLGGSADSGYIRRAARRAQDVGFDTLRLHLRGADRRGDDFYHAGLVEDLHGVATSPTLAEYDRVSWLGFSLGGHVVLRATALGLLGARSVATICAPLDLAAGCRFIDRPRAWPYRRYLLGGLKEMYRAVSTRRPLPLELREAMKISTIREWDDRIVAPRHGFADAEDYYRKMSVGPLLAEIRKPTRIVVARHDPMVELRGVSRYLSAVSKTVSVQLCERGGHVGFPGSGDPLPGVMKFLAE
jgi:predicted alpha/beta-fold hydrolase